jgi:two-component system, NtrC family, sensor histidine kinase HydH
MSRRTGLWSSNRNRVLALPLSYYTGVSRPSWRQWIRPQDFVWLLLFASLAAVSAYRTRQEIVILSCLALLQVAEPKIPFFADDRGTMIAILLKLGFCYLLIGWTGGISSTYYLILLLPVVSAATTLNVTGTISFTLLACITYLSFLRYIDWTRQELTPEAIGEIGLRVVFLVVVAFLTHQLAQANRIEARKYQAAAMQLEAANRSLQAAEAAVRRSERLAALGQLTAGLAHELRNPLGTMRASAEMLAKNVTGENEIARELAGFIATEVDRTNSLITRFLEFARPLKLRLQKSDLAQVADRAIDELSRHNPPYDVKIHRNYSPDVPPLDLDAELMERVVYNLLLNAVQATPRGGGVTVKTREAGERAELSVIDRGSGIAREHLENIFNPFFTTKTEGVGLGLAIVSKIVDEHGGNISAESETGQGSVFRVFLPLRSA